MSHKEKMAELRQILERWNSHNEVHARPVDKMLYEFLSKLLLNIGEEDEIQDPIQFPVENYTPQVEVATDDEGPGGNHPTDPSGNP